MFLRDLEEKKPLYFHRLMADLYEQAAYVLFLAFTSMRLCFYIILTHYNRNGLKTNQSANKIAEAAMAQLNFDEIDG